MVKSRLFTAGALSKKNVVKGFELSILSVAALFQILLQSAGHQDLECVLIWLFQRQDCGHGDLINTPIHQYTDGNSPCTWKNPLMLNAFLEIRVHATNLLSSARGLDPSD